MILRKRQRNKTRKSIISKRNSWMTRNRKKKKEVYLLTPLIVTLPSDTKSHPEHPLPETTCNFTVFIRNEQIKNLISQGTIKEVQQSTSSFVRRFQTDLPHMNHYPHVLRLVPFVLLPSRSCELYIKTLLRGTKVVSQGREGTRNTKCSRLRHQSE